MDTAPLEARIRRIVQPQESDWADLVSLMRPKHLPKGEHIWQPGDVCRHLIFINTGIFRYYYLKADKDISLQFIFDQNFMIDYPSFVNGEPVAYYYRALTDADLIQIDREKLYALIEASPVWQRFARIISEQNAVSLQKSKNSLIIDSPEERYLKLLRDRPKVIRSIPQHMIATYLGITREHLSRLRRKIAGQ